jgi:hypothetical protein
MKWSKERRIFGIDITVIFFNEDFEWFNFSVICSIMGNLCIAIIVYGNIGRENVLGKQHKYR